MILSTVIRFLGSTFKRKLHIKKLSFAKIENEKPTFLKAAWHLKGSGGSTTLDSQDEHKV